MPIYRFRQTFNTDAYKRILNSQLPPAEQIVEITPTRSIRMQVDAPSGAEDDLNDVLAVLGWAPIGAGQQNDDRDDHGVFATADAPTANVEIGDTGFATDGLLGLPTPCFYDGADWRTTIDNTIIDAAATGVATASVNSGGSYIGSDGDYGAFQASTSGSGFGAAFTVTVASGAVTAVVSVDSAGSGYAVSDTITLAIIGVTETTAAVLDVDSIG